MHFVYAPWTISLGLSLGAFLTLTGEEDGSDEAQASGVSEPHVADTYADPDISLLDTSEYLYSTSTLSNLPFQSPVMSTDVYYSSPADVGGKAYETLQACT